MQDAYYIKLLGMVLTYLNYHKNKWCTKIFHTVAFSLIKKEKRKIRHILREWSYTRTCYEFIISLHSREYIDFMRGSQRKLSAKENRYEEIHWIARNKYLCRDYYYYNSSFSSSSSSFFPTDLLLNPLLSMQEIYITRC